MSIYEEEKNEKKGARGKRVDERNYENGVTGEPEKGQGEEKQARKLQATLDGCNPKLRPLTDLLTGVKCRATSVAKKDILRRQPACQREAEKNRRSEE